MKQYFWAGGYAGKEEQGLGLLSWDGDSRSLAWERRWTGLENPSWVLESRDGKHLYAVEELNPSGRIQSLKIGKDLEREACLAAEGADPCHLAETETRLLLVSNYTSGSLAAFALRDGIPQPCPQLIRHMGSGPNPARQEGPHVHSVWEAEGEILAVDLGLDRIVRYVRGEAELRESGDRIALPAGCGPRHLCFPPGHPELLYAVCELSCEVAVLRREQGSYQVTQRISTLPEGFAGENTAAAIRTDGRYVYASNRGHDSIAMLKIREDGGLERADVCPSGGRTPRDFVLTQDGWLLAANQESGRIAVLAADRDKGSLTLTDTFLEAVRPTCLCPASAAAQPDLRADFHR